MGKYKGKKCKNKIDKIKKEVIELLSNFIGDPINSSSSRIMEDTRSMLERNEFVREFDSLYFNPEDNTVTASIVLDNPIDVHNIIIKLE